MTVLSGPVEVGIQRSGRCSLETVVRKVALCVERAISARHVIVVSGGARGVTAEAALASPAPSGPRWYCSAAAPIRPERTGSFV